MPDSSETVPTFSTDSTLTEGTTEKGQSEQFSGFIQTTSHSTESTEIAEPSNSDLNLLQEGTENQISSLNEIIASDDSSEGLKEELGKLVDLLNGLADSLNSFQQ